MITTCLIGVSGYGSVHHEHLLAECTAGRARLLGATVINQDEEPAKCARLRDLGCRIFDDYTAMLDSLRGKAELCVIPTGIPLHRPMTEAAAKAGMHVLVEKPAAGCIQDVRAMEKAAVAAGKSVSVAFQFMYAPATLEAKRAILGGAIGDIEVVKCRTLWPRDNEYYTRNNWAGRLRLGDTWVLDSPINNAVAHELMMTLFLAGPSEREAATPVSVEAELYRANRIESADTACIRIRTREGIEILFYAAHACSETRNPEVTVRGTRGTLVHSRGGAAIVRGDGSREELGTHGQDEAHRCMLRSVFGAIRGGSEFCCNLGLAAAQTTVVNAAHEACAVRAVEDRTLVLDNGNSRRVVPEIETAMERAFQEEKLLRECGAAWALPAGVCGCEEYERFSGPAGAN
jgi:predicted dehydrogenase